MTLLHLQSCLSELFCWLNLRSIIFFIHTYIFHNVYNLRKTIKLKMLTKIKVALKNIFLLIRMIRVRKSWRVISRNGNLQSKEEENNNGMAAGDQIQCDFCTFSSIPFSNDPVIHLYECYKDASCHLRFLQSSKRIPGECGNFFMYSRQFFHCIRMGIFPLIVQLSV